MKNIAFCFFLFLFFQVATAQNYFISDGIIKASSGYFYDSGGPSEKYKGGEEYVCVVTTPETGSKLILQFQQFDLADGDWLAVYNGESIDAPLIDIFSNKKPISDKIKAHGLSLTLVFHSESGSSAEGWVAQIMPKEEKPISSGADFHAEEGAVLIYSLKGLKSESDGLMIEQFLAKQEYVIDSEVHLKQENLYVNCDNDSFAFTIKDLIVEYTQTLGYEISIDFMRSVVVTGHGDSH